LRLKLYNFGFLILVLSPSAFTKSATLSVRYGWQTKSIDIGLKMVDKT